MRQTTTTADASLYRQDWTCHHASRHAPDVPFIPCQDCYRPRYAPTQADEPRQEMPAAYIVARLYAGQPAPTYYRADLHQMRDRWTPDPSEATRIHGTRAELRAAFGPDVILIPQAPQCDGAAIHGACDSCTSPDC